MRRLLLAINNCVFHYGKYINAFKPNITQGGYVLTRVNFKEFLDSCEILAKDDLEEDERRKLDEISHLGLLSKFYITGTDKNKPKEPNKDKEPNFSNEVNSVDEKIKSECIKVYTGEYVKLLNNPDKIPQSLIPFIQGIKTEMENLRLKCVRDLRTYVRLNFNSIHFSVKNYLTCHYPFLIIFLILSTHMLFIQIKIFLIKLPNNSH
jgi:hypothetical protein